MENRQITSKTVWFQVDVENHIDRRAIDTIIETGINPLSCCENLIVFGTNVLFLNRYKKMSLKHGMETVQKTLQLTEKPVRIKPDSPLPGYCFDKYLGVESIDDESIVKLQGDIIRCELKALVVAAKAVSQNNTTVKHVLKKGTTQCVRDGVVPMTQAQSVKTTEQMLINDEIEKACLCNDLENGFEIAYTVLQTKKDVIIKSFKDPSLANTTVKRDHSEMSGITYYNDVMKAKQRIKKKHYYIYSNQPGYGKSSFSDTLLDNLNACSVNDSNNFSGVRDTAQFIIFDEFSHDTKISFPDLKKLTGGNASVFGGNKKTFGDSFKPRADVQVIMFSNHHLFECIGKYNQHTKRRAVDFNTARQMVERFHIIKLDDEVETEFGDAVQHIDFFENMTVNNPFDVKFDSDGHPINKEGHLTSYSLACTYDTRYNKAFNAIKQSILDKILSFTVTNEKLYHTDDRPKQKTESKFERKRIAMLVEDTLKRYIYLHRGRLDEFTDYDIAPYNKLKFFIDHQEEFLANERYMEFIYNNRYDLYEYLGDEHMVWIDLEGKWYHPDNHKEILKALKEYSGIRHHEIEMFFICVMENINNPKHAQMIKNMDADIKRMKQESAERAEERERKKNIKIAEEQEQERLKQQQLAKSSQENAMAMETV